MKQFNLEEYLLLKEEGREPKIVTREGNPVRIICTDRKSDNDSTIVALEDAILYEIVTVCRGDGSCYEYKESGHDLFFAPTKHEGWINIYHETGCPSDHITGNNVFTSYDNALACACKDSYVATIKIEWEE